nr:hypothetical protein CoNPh37_CDS0193 [Staphylococcus phage S-CoN_Ph37]
MAIKYLVPLSFFNVICFVSWMKEESWVDKCLKHYSIFFIFSKSLNKF